MTRTLLKWALLCHSWRVAASMPFMKSVAMSFHSPYIAPSDHE
jgi:hypothetical protein